MDLQNMKPHPDSVIVRILGRDRESVFKKTIQRDDGTVGELYISTDLKMVMSSENHQVLVPLEEDDIDKSQRFVRTGIIEAVGANVLIIAPGDTALLDYTVDNDENCIIGWDGSDKLVSIKAVTEYYKEDIIERATRYSPRDQVVAFKGEIKELTRVIAVIRGKRVIANDPYVILEEQPAEKTMVSPGGILYVEQPEVIKRRVISIPLKSIIEKRIPVNNGDEVYVRESDTFLIVVDGEKLTAVNDIDILAKHNPSSSLGLQVW